jgi:hypothetical protein
MRLVGYAKIKVEMNKYIDSVINKNPDGIDINVIFLQIDNLFGLGTLAVRRRLDLLKDVGMIEIDGDMIRVNKR